MSEHEHDPEVEERILAEATEASPDTEADLARLYELAAYLRVDPALKREYEELRNSLVRRLKVDGPRIFADAGGRKHVGYPTVPTTVVVDLDKAAAMRRRRGERRLTAEALDLIAPRKQNLGGLAKARAAGMLTDEQLLELADEVPGTGYMSWLELDGDDPGE